MSGDILFLAHRLPFPADRGDKIRSHHVLKALARLAPVHVGCLAEDRSDYDHEQELAALAASYCMPQRSKSLPLAGVEALGRGEPVSLAAFRSDKLRRWVREILHTKQVSAIYVFSGQMGQYVPVDWSGRLIVDLVDVDSAKFEAYSAERNGPRGWIDAREARLLRQIESDLANRADATLLVSDAEAEMLRTRVTGNPQIRALRNGIDCDYFDPEKVDGHAALATGGPHFVFTGQMDYPPNIAAVTRFARDILPSIRKSHADARFHVVGRAPVDAVSALGAGKGVCIWGAVPDVRPFLKSADMVVAPLTIARGVQNKVLEAMAMGRCVLASPQASVGLDARHGEHLVLCEDDRAFVSRVLHLQQRKSERDSIGSAARDLVKQTMTWPAMLAELPALMSGNPLGARDAA